MSIPLIGEEIKSTVSDTWSTDVLASDSEPPEQNQTERLAEIAEEMVRQNLLGVHMTEVSAIVQFMLSSQSKRVANLILYKYC